MEIVYYSKNPLGRQKLYKETIRVNVDLLRNRTKQKPNNGNGLFAPAIVICII
jgi:hypothetical protein